MSTLDSNKLQILKAEDAKRSGRFDSWTRGLTSAARVKGCAAALAPNRLVHDMLQVSLNKAHEVVANDQASRLAKIEGEGDDAVAARAAIAVVPVGRITSATLNQQWDLALLVQQWTHNTKDWPMFNKVDNDDPELGTKMMLMVMRKYMSSGSAPSQDWTLEMHRKQGENETSADVWDRIKTCAAALESCGRIQSHLSLIDALKQNLGPAHVSWVNNIDDSYTLEDVDVAVYDKGRFVDHKENKGDSSGRAAYPAADQADARDLTISELTACIARLEDQVNRLASGGSSSKDNGHFTGTCHYCKKPGHKISDCKKLKDKNRASGKNSGGSESSGSGAAFPACLVAHCDCSDFSDHTSSVPMLSLHNPFDVLGDMDFLPEEIVDELMYGAEAASGEVRGEREAHTGAATQVPVPETLPELQSPPELDFDKTQKLDWVWDFISRQWVDPGRFPAILERRTTPSGFVYTSLFDLADYGDYETLDHVTMESEYNSLMGKFVKTDEPDSGKAGPSRIPTYSERIGKVTVEEFELPSCYGTGSGFAARNFSDDESSDSSDDDEIAHGISHHEKRLLRCEARLTRWNKRNPDHGGSFPSRELHLSDESSSVASSSDDTWVTDDSADEDTASVDPAFDRQRLQQRYSSALRRAGMRRSRPRSYASFVRMANRTIWNARNRTYFRPTGELSPSDFSIRIAGHIVTWTRRSSGHATSLSDAQCYASHGPGRSSHVRSGHRWLMDSGANNHMVTEESDCTSDITPLSGFITGVSVDIVGQGNCEIYVTTSSGESIPATIYGVKITLDLATRTNGAFTRIFSVRQAVRNGCSVLFSPTENSLSLPDGTNIPLDSENGLY